MESFMAAVDIIGVCLWFITWSKSYTYHTCVCTLFPVIGQYSSQFIILYQDSDVNAWSWYLLQVASWDLKVWNYYYGLFVKPKI